MEDAQPEAFTRLSTPCGSRHSNVESEANVRGLATRLHRLRATRGGLLRTIGVTSGRRREGTSTVVANLALELAQRGGQSVVLVDANLAAAALHQVFGVDAAPGIVGDLANRAAAPPIHDTMVPQLRLVTAGACADQDAVTCSLTKLISLVETLAEQYDWVLVDLPAVEQNAPWARLAGFLDGVVLVVAGDAVRGVAAEGKRRLERIGANVLGAVFNQGFDASRDADHAAFKRAAARPTMAPPTTRIKRAVDVLLGSLALILMLPGGLLIAAGIKLASRGPVFFRQQRVGLWGQTFGIWKFRTMCVDNDASAHQQYVESLAKNDTPLTKMDGAQRLIPLGGWLRSLALDEIPQLINVLRGDMSLVGPRPDVIPLDAYEYWQRARFDVLPGMTGLWQVSGKNKTTFGEMIRLDLTYIRRRSLWLDLKILLATGPAIVGQMFDRRSR